MNALSLFSGIGGLDLAAEWAGFKTVAFCERDKFCQKVLAKHWPEVKIYDDVRTLDGSELPAIDLLHGGIPCQPFSQLGAKRGAGDHRHLWPEMFRIVQKLRPTWIVGENVANFANMALHEVYADLESIGYEVQSFIIPACSVDAPHVRKRLWICANANGGRQQQELSVTKSDRRRMEAATKRMGEPWVHNPWALEPSVRRVVDGIPRRVDRLRSLGNAVVPQQAYPIFAAIAETYNNESERGEPR